VTRVAIDAAGNGRALELWRHSVGLGGISPEPLPAAAAAAVRLLRPRLVRIFVQEFFRAWNASGRADWRRLDAYLDAVATTGAKVVAAITLKPPVLFPTIDAARWQPTDTGRWQELIRALVHRYSVEKPLVTHWEIGNEPDIGEAGGSPYLIRDARDYLAYYRLTAQAVRQAFPAARVGGPANAGLLNPPLPEFVERCRAEGTRLDFLSWHLYHSDPDLHAHQTAVARLLTRRLEPRPELLLTEWNCGFSPRTDAEQSVQPWRAAAVAAIVLALHRAGLDYSFYYHVHDQRCCPADFAPFFSPAGIAGMVRHWNERPHRFGLFGVDGELRPQYFVFQMLTALGDEELDASSTDPAVRVLAGRRGSDVAILAVNYSIDAPGERLVQLCLGGLRAGPRRLALFRLDAAQRWSAPELRLLPLETRRTWVGEHHECELRLPAHSVALLRLDTCES